MAIGIDELVADIAGAYGGWASGTATGGTTTTLQDASRIEPDNEHVNRYVRWTSGANLGAERLCSAFHTPYLTMSPALANTVTAGDTYQISPLRREAMTRNVTRAVRRAGHDYLSIKTDANSSFTVGVQEYALPTDCVLLLNVWIWNTLNPLNNLYDPTVGGWTPFTEFAVLGAQGGQTLQLRGWNTIYAQPGYAIQRKLEYAALPTYPSDSQGLGLNAGAERDAISFVEQYALYLLHLEALAANPTGDNGRSHNTLAQACLEEAMRVQAQREPLRLTRKVQQMHIGGQR